MDKKTYISLQETRGMTGSATSDILSPWIETFVKDHPIQEPILDIGCGDGSFVKYCRKQGKYAIGYDISQSAVKKAMDAGIHLVYGDAQDGLPFPDKSFKMVTLFHSMEHFIHPKKAIKHINRVLDGHICIIVPIQGRGGESHGHFSYYTTVEEIEADLKGFKTVHTENWGNMILLIAKNNA